MGQSAGKFPPADIWRSPISWRSGPVSGLAKFGEYIPVTAEFTRAEVKMKWIEDSASMERSFPGLLSLKMRRIASIHVAGLDGNCWTFKITRKGTRALAELYIGPDFPAKELVAEDRVSRFQIQQITVQSLLPMFDTPEPLRLVIRGDWSVVEGSSGPGESSPGLPPTETWWSPTSWVGDPPQPVLDRFDSFSENAVFVRAQAQITFSESVGPGMSRQSFLPASALLRLDQGSLVEFHLSAADGRCWTYRTENTGKKKTWKVFMGHSLPAQDTVPASGCGGTTIERVTVQSLIPSAISGKHIIFAVDDEGSFEDYSKAIDSDPND